jgi:hypothetical protein
MKIMEIPPLWWALSASSVSDFLEKGKGGGTLVAVSGMGEKC